MANDLYDAITRTMAQEGHESTHRNDEKQVIAEKEVPWSTWEVPKMQHVPYVKELGKCRRTKSPVW